MVQEEGRFVDSTIEIIRWPSGITTQAGGTRTAINLDRPWQVSLRLTNNCPLCRRYAAEPSVVAGIPPDWSVVINDFTPHRFHRLIIPSTCWSEESLRMIGGTEQIANAITIALKVMEDSREAQLLMGIHVGYLAGQNVRHLHWHLLRTTEISSPPTESRWSAIRKLQTEDLIVAENHAFAVSAGGIRAGGLIVAPKEFLPVASTQMILTFAKVLNDSIALCNRKYISTEGLRPDFKAVIHLYSGHLDLAEYVPILNQWGFTESYQFTFGPITEIPIILPWPHRETARYLKS